MFEFLTLINNYLPPFILSYIFITITGYNLMDGMVDYFEQRMDKDGYKYTNNYDVPLNGIAKFFTILKYVINPITSLGLIVVSLTKNDDIYKMLLEDNIKEGTIVHKKINDSKTDDICNKDNKLENLEIHEKEIKKDNNCSMMSNEEKLRYLENEKEILINSSSKEFEQEKIDKYVLTKKF